MKVLVVDDNILDRKYIENLLENYLDIKPHTAKDGLEALKKIRTIQYDLVITDVVMPKIEGIELIENIKQISPKTNIIAISGSNPYYLYIINKMGIEDTYSKPIDTTRFLDHIKNIDKKRPEALHKK
jgi:YesN/AraC family two-component response regulator